MDGKMTLEQVRDDMDKLTATSQDAENWQVVEWCAAIDAHLAQPAQAVDVGAIRDVIATFKGAPIALGLREQQDAADALTSAIGNASTPK